MGRAGVDSKIDRVEGGENVSAETLNADQKIFACIWGAVGSRRHLVKRM